MRDFEVKVTAYRDGGKIIITKTVEDSNTIWAIQQVMKIASIDDKEVIIVEAYDKLFT